MVQNNNLKKKTIPCPWCHMPVTGKYHPHVPGSGQQARVTYYCRECKTMVNHQIRRFEEKLFVGF